MRHHEFRNLLCILHSIDAREMVAAGVIDHGDGANWQAFRSNPARFFLRLDDDRAERLWGLLTARHEGRAA